nr:unnamed protein product [Spirometra erinaceieuropaei]
MSFKKDVFLGILSVIGGVLIHFTYGHFYTIVWISAIALAVQGISMPLGGAVLPKIGYRAVVIIGSAINSGSVLLTYITIQKGFAYVVLSYAVMLGFGFGFSYAVIFSVAASWFPARRGLIVGTIVGGFGLGALVFTPVQTAFINPNNVAVNQTTGMFEDEALLQRVPEAFLMLGGTLAALQFIGIILLRQKPSEPEKKGSNAAATNSKEELKPLSKAGDEAEKNADAQESVREADTRRAGDVEIQAPPATVGESMHSLHVSHTNLAPAMDEKEKIRRQSVAPPVEINYPPVQILRRHEFYLLWGVMLCNIIPITLITASFKFVGQKTISDDRFLSNVATASSLFNSGGRIMWGAICDRFSFKIPLSIMLTVWAALLFTFPYIGTIPTAGKALYALWVCTLFLSLSGVFVLMPAATGRIFGPVYMAVNYGMVFSAFAVGSIICALISELLKGEFVFLYTMCGFVCVLGLFLLIWIHDPFIARKLNLCRVCSATCQRCQPRVPLSAA